MAIIRIEGGKWHSLDNKDGKMFAKSSCDCGNSCCPTIIQDVNEGDTIISSIQISIFGNLKRLKIIAQRIHIHDRHPVTLNGIDWIPYKKELDTTKPI